MSRLSLRNLPLILGFVMLAAGGALIVLGGGNVSVQAAQPSLPAGDRPLAPAGGAGLRKA